MPEDQHKYKPINCDFYDHIEIMALRNHWVRLEYIKEEENVIETTKVRTTKTKAQIEYLVTEDGTEIRMDWLTSITRINPASDMRINLLEKLSYNHWANLRLLNHLESLSEYPSNIVLKMSHIINAHDSWNRQILQMNPRLSIWEATPQEEWNDLFLQINTETKRILKHGGVERIIKYQNTNSEFHQSTIADIIYHVINHGTYHRGQISDILSSAGLKALATDYILFSQSQQQQL